MAAGMELGSSSTDAKRLRLTKWTEEDEILLTKAWINVTNDGLGEHFPGSKRETSWIKLSSYYNKHVQNQMPRTCNQLRKKWIRMKQVLRKFCEYHEQVVSDSPADLSDDELMTRVYLLYKKCEQSNFPLEHAWRILKNEPIWRCGSGKCPSAQSKRLKISVSGEYASSSNLEQSEAGDNEAREELEGSEAGENGAREELSVEKVTEEEHLKEKCAVIEVKESDSSSIKDAGRYTEALMDQNEIALLTADMSKMHPLQRQICELKLQQLLKKYKSDAGN